ncbi:MAG: hypothetical protein AABX48_03775 [Nanoarchaeota archaeon]
MLNLEDIKHLPDVELNCKVPFEIGCIAPLRIDPKIIKFDRECFIIGKYKDENGNYQIVFTDSIRPFSPPPMHWKLEHIHSYLKTKDY